MRREVCRSDEILLNCFQLTPVLARVVDSETFYINLQCNFAEVLTKVIQSPA